MVIQWIIILVFIFIGLWYLKLEHHTRKIKVAVIVAIGALIYFSMMSIFTSEDVDLRSPRGIVHAVYVYFGWIGQTASNLWDVGDQTVSMVGNAIKINDSSGEEVPINRLAKLRGE